MAQTLGLARSLSSFHSQPTSRQGKQQHNCLEDTTMDIFDAIEDHHLQVLEKLLAEGANPNTPQPDSPTWVPLKSAIEELADDEPLEAVTLLLRFGAGVEGVREPGDASPLLVAVLNSQFEASLILLAAGANPNARDNEGATPLALSISNNDKRLEKALRLCGATASFR